VNGEKATVAAYFHNPMVLPQPGGGIYHHELVRTPEARRSHSFLEELVCKEGYVRP